MSQHHRDHEDVLRRALHSAVDSMEVSGDGLERIQARLTTPRPAPLAWVMAAPSAVARRALIGLSAVWAWLQPLVAWMVAERAKVARRARTGLSAASALLALVMASLRTGWRRLVPGPPGRTSESGGAARPGAPSGRARLVAAVAAVTFVLALSVSALTPFGRQLVKHFRAMEKKAQKAAASHLEILQSACAKP